MPHITATTGTSTIKGGVSSLQIGLVKPDGTYVVREMHRHFPNQVTDVVRQTVPASTMGANAGVLGSWVTREINVPDKTVMFLTYAVKSSSMPIKKTMTLAFEFDETYPLIEMLFKVVTDRYSTLFHLPIMARMRLLSIDEIKADMARVKYGLPVKHEEAIKQLETLSEEAVLNHWANLASHRNDEPEGKTFLTVTGNSNFEEYPIMLKYMMPARPSAPGKAVGKTVKTSSGKKVTIASRKRRIKLN